VVEHGGGDRDRAQHARQRRADRIKRFTECQRHIRGWINFAEIADWYADVRRNTTSRVDGRIEALELLKAAFLAGDFVEGGRSRVLYLHQATPKAKLRPDELQTAIDLRDDQIVLSEYLSHCWVPRDMFGRWLKKHCLEESPARFQPLTEESRKPRETSPPKRGAPLRNYIAEKVLPRMFPSGVPPRAKLSDKNLVHLVQEELAKEDIRASGDTILRAAKRRKK